MELGKMPKTERQLNAELDSFQGLLVDDYRMARMSAHDVVIKALNSMRRIQLAVGLDLEDRERAGL